MRNLRTKVAVVTGAAAGLGRQIATTLAREGVYLVLADHDQTVHDVAAEIAGITSNAVSAVHDITAPDGCAAIIDRARKAFGKIDILVNNAVIWRPTPLDLPWDQVVPDFDAIMDWNVKGSLMMMRLCVSEMKGHGGDIVNITTHDVLPAREPNTNWAACDAYNASRWAVNGLTDAAAQLLFSEGIRVNGIAIGLAQTPIRRQMEAHARDVPQSRHGLLNSAAVANLLVALLEDGRSGENIGIWPGEPVELGPPKRWDSKIRERADFTGRPTLIYGAPPWPDAPPPVDHLSIGRPNRAEQE